MRHSRLVLAIALASGLAAAQPSAPDAGAPRPLSDAEREAVSAVLDYLSRGAPAFQERLASRSPWRDVPPAAFAQEMSARWGAPRGARLALRAIENGSPLEAAFAIESASGLDDLAVIRFVTEGSSLRIDGVRTLSEPVAHPPKTAPAPPQPSTPPWRTSIPVAAVGLVAAVFLRSRPAAALGMAFAGIAAAVALHLFALRPPAGDTAAPAKPSRPFTSLASLATVRVGLDAGDGDAVTRLRALAAGGSDAAQTAHTWLASRALSAGDLVEAESRLRTLAADQSVPMAEVIRGRLAFARYDKPAAIAAYDAARLLPPVTDVLLLEASAVLAALGYESAAQTTAETLAASGTRDAEARYLVASLHASRQAFDEAAREFEVAWRCRPIERRRLFRHAAMGDLLLRPNLYASLRLDATFEPADVPADARSKPIVVPPGAVSRITGSELEVEVGGAVLRVPGGHVLAPLDALAEDAGAAGRRQRQRALVAAEPLLSNPPSVAAWAQPRSRRELGEALQALVDAVRWNDVEALTRHLTGAEESVPTDAFLSRVEALRRLRRAPEARQLAATFARNAALLRRESPLELLSVAQSLRAVGDPALAADVAARAAAKLKVEGVGFFVRALREEARVDREYAPTSTAHYRIRIPEDFRPAAQKVGYILEAERERLTRWIPSAEPADPVDVYLLRLEQFRLGVSGNASIVGVYDGAIRVPLAEVQVFEPELVDIMTHEVAHALIAQATKDRAPKWYHEGLAQLVEQREVRTNVVRTHLAKGEMLSLGSLEAVLDGMAAGDLVGRAYAMSDWLMRFIETRWGVDGIRRLGASFAQGRGTEEALAQDLHIGVAAFDIAFAAWIRSEAPETVTTKAIRYDRWGADEIQLTNRRAGDRRKGLSGEVPESLRSSKMNRGSN